MEKYADAIVGVMAAILGSLAGYLASVRRSVKIETEYNERIKALEHWRDVDFKEIKMHQDLKMKWLQDDFKKDHDRLISLDRRKDME